MKRRTKASDSDPGDEMADEEEDMLELPPPSEDTDLQAQIAYWDAVFLRSAPQFDWTANNELRNLYNLLNEEEKSMQCVDTILEHSFMDYYMLSILSDWSLGNDPGIAVALLSDRAERCAHFPHLRAACLIAAGDVCREVGKTEYAKTFYRKVSAPLPFTKPESLYRYYALAEFHAN